MQRDAEAYESGKAESRQECAAAHLRYYSGAPSEGWGRDLAEILRLRFGIEVVFVHCFVTANSLSYEEGWNDALEEHVDGKWGRGAFKAVLAEVRLLRERAYEEWLAHNRGTDTGG